ncbi:MAG: metallophosphoesterase [Alistipes senegalensis]|nr:metallophosphoesterase [Bacteroides cellulosilyticus]MCM1352525.1 metallophosphoesterase [Alistipes senegalensis]
MKKGIPICFFLLWAELLHAALPGVKIETKPYLQAVTETGFTVVWVSDTDAVAWVEVAPDDGSDFYATERPRYYHSEHGKRAIGRLHRVPVTGLESGTRYRYRIFTQGILENGGNKGVIRGRVASSRVYKHEPYYATTLDSDKEEISFVVVNDIHGKDSLLRRLLGDVTERNTDFVVMNGDMTSMIESEEQLLDGYLRSASELFAGNVPFYFVRGNHENRGAFSYRALEYFPTPTGRFYYTFRHGPAFFVVLDCGEDKPDNDIEYSGLADFDRYREVEADWLKEVVASDEFRRAPLRIVLIHIPPLHYDWHGGREIQRLFMLLLQGAGVDLMLCGHLHESFYTPAGEDRYDFPVLINSNRESVRVVLKDRTIEAEIKDAAGKTVVRHAIVTGSE